MNTDNEAHIQHPMTHSATHSDLVGDEVTSLKLIIGSSCRRPLQSCRGITSGVYAHSLSPQRGEGQGEGWERSTDSYSNRTPLKITTPHPQSLSPRRGRNCCRVFGNTSGWIGQVIVLKSICVSARSPRLGERISVRGSSYKLYFSR